jgi:hypothetical protein
MPIANFEELTLIPVPRLLLAQLPQRTSGH